MLRISGGVKANLAVRALALGLVLVQATGLVHLALTPHQICFEHGELVELGPAALSAGREAELDSSATDALRASEEAESFGSGHQHCLVSARRRDEAPASTGLSLPVEVAAVRDPPPALPARKRIAMWRVAPKQGPPAA